MITEIGKVYTKSLIPLSAHVPEGRIAAVLSEPDKNNPEPSWMLIFEQGGGWVGFLDADQYDAKALHNWMPDAVEDAVKELKQILGDNYGNVTDEIAQDLEWFESWAANAKAALKI